jgi:hypothetical protein
VHPYKFSSKALAGRCGRDFIVSEGRSMCLAYIVDDITNFVEEKPELSSNAAYLRKLNKKTGVKI